MSIIECKNISSSILLYVYDIIARWRTRLLSAIAWLLARSKASSGWAVRGYSGCLRAMNDCRDLPKRRRQPAVTGAVNRQYYCLCGQRCPESVGRRFTTNVKLSKLRYENGSIGSVFDCNLFILQTACPIGNDDKICKKTSSVPP